MNLRNDQSKKETAGLIAAWRQLRERTQIGVIQSKEQYENMVELLNSLIDKVGDDDKHELSGLLDLVGALIENYEGDNVRIPSLSPRETLKFLMDQHGLKQKDLREELGSQGVVSEILNGKRKINARQAKALSDRFNVSPSLFI